MDLFFVISGFLIGGILLDTKQAPGYFRNFYARRVLRIFPIYYLCIGLFFLLIPLAQPGAYFQTQFLRESGSPWWYFLYLGNIRESIVGVEPSYVLAPFWSLSIEEQFYIFFPLAVWLLSRRGLLRLLWGLVVLAPAVRLCALLLWPDNERIQYLFTLSRVDVLAMGALIAVYFRSSPPLAWPRWIPYLAFAMLAGLAATFALGGFNRFGAYCRVAGYSQLALTFALLTMAVLRGRGQSSTAWLRSPPLTGLGRISYGLYVLQRPMEVILLKALPVLGIALDPQGMPLMLAKWGVAIAAAALSWRFFEKPILRFKKRFASAGHPLG